MRRRPHHRVLFWLAVSALAATVLAAFSRPSGGAAPPAAPAPAPSPHGAALIVRARNADALPALEALTRGLGYAVRGRAAQPPALLVEAPPGRALDAAVADFTARPGVLYAEPAAALRASDTPADPLFASHQRAYLDPLGAPAAWDVTTGSPAVIVAVLDTGLDVSHPEFAGRIWRNGREVPANGVDDDANGCVDDVEGCAFLVAPDASCAGLAPGAVTDDVGHGTFVAGVIAAAADGRGTVGVARNTTILPVKILDCTGGGNTFALAQAILYAAAQGARVLNVSLGGPIDSAYVRETIRIARERYAALLVAATGNNGEAVSYPAKYDGVLAVGATTPSGTERAPYSNTGPEVDVVAFGGRIASTVPASACGRFECLPEHPGYALASGTSFAAPQASGLAALLLARNPFLGPDALIGMIRNTADPMAGGGPPGWAGAGRINMQRAMSLPHRLGVPGASRD